MSYVWCTWLADELRKGGCDVIEESGWKNRGRPSSSGSFNPYGVTVHHTGTKTSSSNPHPTVGYCISGDSSRDLPGPLCQVLICYAGHCHVIAAGRANHAGPSNGWGPFSSGDGNWQTIGFEIDYNGTQDMSDLQEDAVYRANAAVLKKFGRSTSYLASHWETSTSGKWDPGYHGDKCDMDYWRAETNKYISSQPKPPEPEKKGIPDMIYCTSSDGRGWLIGVGVKTLINTPATRDKLLAAGVPNAGTWSGDVLNEFTTWESAYDKVNDQLNTIIGQTK